MNLCTELQNLLDLCTALLQNLLDDISGELGGNLMDLCTALFTPRWEYVAGWIDRAIQVGRFGGSSRISRYASSVDIQGNPED